MKVHPLKRLMMMKIPIQFRIHLILWLLLSFVVEDDGQQANQVRRKKTGARASMGFGTLMPQREKKYRRIWFIRPL
jgi:hypothetical protein